VIALFSCKIRLYIVELVGDVREEQVQSARRRAQSVRMVMMVRNIIRFSSAITTALNIKERRIEIMAVTETLVKRTVQINVQDGTTAGGTTKAVKRTISNVNPEATAAQLHATASAISTLMDNTVMGIYYDDKKLLEEVVDEQD